MKKIISSILIICVIFIISACGKAGKEMQLSLKGNPTTGYEWTCQISNPEIVKETGNEYIPEEHEEDIVGSGGTYTFTFAGLKTGGTDIICRYARSFEDVEPIYMLTYQVEIDEDLLIKLVTKTGTYSENNIPEPIIK